MWQFIACVSNDKILLIYSKELLERFDTKFNSLKDLIQNFNKRIKTDKNSKVLKV